MAGNGAGREPEWQLSTPALERVRGLGRVLDNAIPIPGTPWRIGLDGIIGLIPGVGDFAGGLLSLYVIYTAARLGAPVPALGMMAINVMADQVVGAIPLLGDLFDFGFKSNMRNVRILERWLEKHPAPPGRSAGEIKMMAQVFVTVILVALLLLIVAMAYLSIFVLRALIGLS